MPFSNREMRKVATRLEREKSREQQALLNQAQNATHQERMRLQAEYHQNSIRLSRLGGSWLEAMAEAGNPGLSSTYRSVGSLFRPKGKHLPVAGWVIGAAYHHSGGWNFGNPTASDRANNIWILLNNKYLFENSPGSRNEIIDAAPHVDIIVPNLGKLATQYEIAWTAEENA